VILNITLSMMKTDIVDLIEVVRKPAARRMRLIVDSKTGQVKLVLPRLAPIGPAMDWARGHQAWIEEQLAKLPDPWPITPPMLIPFAGRDLWLDWAEHYPRNPKLVHDGIRVGGPRDLLAGRMLRWLRREALILLDKETREFADIAGVTLGRVGVGDPRSRWGSCAPAGDIRYSWRLILAPDDVRRATVAHEVAHRTHMDHSPAFHAEVKRLFGRDPKSERQWLRQNGARLHWFGKGA
jgi:predicted metal-dependent hydrolase